MTPDFTKLNQPNQTGINAEVFGNLALFARVLPNGDYIALGKLGHSVRGAMLAALSALANHINHVVGLGSKKQMGRVHACRNVAAVENAKTRWNIPVLEHPSHAMSRLHSAIEPKRAVSISTAHPGLPKPAAIGFVYAPPETRSRWFRSSATDGAKPICFKRCAFEFPTARLASAGVKMVNSHVTSLGSLVRSAVRIPVLPRFAYFTTKNWSVLCC